MTHWIEAGRVVNAVLATLDLVVLLCAIRGWRDRSPGNRFHWSGLALLLFSVAYGNLEALNQGAQGGLRTALLTVALVYLMFGLWTKLRGQWREDKLEQTERQRRSERLRS